MEERKHPRANSQTLTIQEVQQENVADHDTDREASIAAVLSKETELAEFPTHMQQHYVGRIEELARTLYLIDGQIQEVNRMLHITQGPRPGKISVRFLQPGTKAANRAYDRVPCAVKWWSGHHGPLVYTRIRHHERLAKFRPKISKNVKAIRKLLTLLQELLDKRRLITEALYRFEQSTFRLKLGAEGLVGRCSVDLNEIRSLVEVDYTKSE